MNEIEKQITILHELQCKCVENGFFSDIELAETALQEKAEREKGCEYCLRMANMPFEEHDVYIDGNGKLDVDADEDYQLNFCPMCGRKLEVDK